MREVTIDERDFETPADLHAYIAHELGFPSYYGANLPALSDCLTDICEPTRITIVRRAVPGEELPAGETPGEELPAGETPTGGQAAPSWFDRFCRVIERCGLESDALEVVLRR